MWFHRVRFDFAVLYFLYLSNIFTAVRARTSTSRDIFFCFFCVRAAKKQACGTIWYVTVVCVVLGGTLLRPTAGAIRSVDPKMHHPAKRSLAMCEHTGGVLRDFIVIHRDICREHSLIGRSNCLMTESANSLSKAAGPELSTTRNPIANLASDSATAGLAWVRACVLWRAGASVRRTQAERWLYCATPCVGMIFTKPRFQ